MTSVLFALVATALVALLAWFYGRAQFRAGSAQGAVDVAHKAEEARRVETSTAALPDDDVARKLREQWTR